MKKKFFSLVLAVLMIMSALPMGAFAVQDLPKSMYTYADDLSEEENDNKPVEKIKIKFLTYKLIINALNSKWLKKCKKNNDSHII